VPEAKKRQNSGLVLCSSPTRVHEPASGATGLCQMCLDYSHLPVRLISTPQPDCVAPLRLGGLGELLSAVSGPSSCFAAAQGSHEQG